jgi:pimeloyl-ACP methyl ester carboxylesterase
MAIDSWGPRLARSWRRFARLRWLALFLAVTALVTGLVYHSWVAAQGRAFVVLTRTGDVPVLSWATGVVTSEPRVEQTIVAGRPTTVVRPGKGRAWPALIFANGVTRRGRLHPKVQRLARALARAGYLVLVPDLPGMRDGEITGRTVAATIAVARVAATRPDARGGRVGLFGVSVGATLSLLAAEDPRLGERVTVVAGVAPYVDLREVVRLVTTGFYRDRRRLVRYRTEPFAALVVARSLVAALQPSRARAVLLARLEAVPDNAKDPLAALRGSAERLDHGGRALVRLLANRDPARFDRLYSALPPRVRAYAVRLSPLAAARRLRAPVLLASAPHDKYFPPAEALALARGAPHVRVTVTRTLQHAVPRFSLHDLGGLFSFDAFLVRALEASR